MTVNKRCNVYVFPLQKEILISNYLLILIHYLWYLLGCCLFRDKDKVDNNSNKPESTSDKENQETTTAASENKPTPMVITKEDMKMKFNVEQSQSTGPNAQDIKDGHAYLRPMPKVLYQVSTIDFLQILFILLVYQKQSNWLRNMMIVLILCSMSPYCYTCELFMVRFL